ncbi:MAG: hypothetical protein H2069_04365 [Legionella sp.]|nr:hypothetical protein [Legionella sp.]
MNRKKESFQTITASKLFLQGTLEKTIEDAAIDSMTFLLEKRKNLLKRGSFKSMLDFHFYNKKKTENNIKSLENLIRFIKENKGDFSRICCQILGNEIDKVSKGGETEALYHTILDYSYHFKFTSSNKEDLDLSQESSGESSQISIFDEPKDITPTEIPIDNHKLNAEKPLDTTPALDKESILEKYRNSQTILPPNDLEPIFFSPEQDQETKDNLSISYIYLQKKIFTNEEHTKNLQLFEIPNTHHNCQSYAQWGHSSHKYHENDDARWNPSVEEGWVELKDSSDLACKKGFEKVIEYGGRNNHLGRMYGDGTILHKMGNTKYGATPVLRVTDPYHPYIMLVYRQPTKVWIKPSSSEVVPQPCFRWQSVHYLACCLFGKPNLAKSLEDIKRACNEEPVIFSSPNNS